MSVTIHETNLAHPKLSGKEFERQLIYAMDRTEADGLATMDRSGVMATIRDGKWEPMDSLPDFEGHFADGLGFKFDAKACTQSKFDIDHTKGIHKRQLPHLLKRSRFRVITFLAIHWNERVLKTRTDRAETWLFPVHESLPFWQRVLCHEVSAIRRDDCYELGVPVTWVLAPRARIARPDLFSSLHQLRLRMEGIT